MKNPTVEEFCKQFLDAAVHKVDEAAMEGVTQAKASPPVTFDQIRAQYDYVKPEKVTIRGEELEIHGYNVHTEHCPPGFTVLTEKHNPNSPIPKRGKMIVINEPENKVLVYEPPEEDEWLFCTEAK